MAKCRKLKTPVRTKSGRMRRCKIKSGKRKSRKSRKSRSRRVSGGSSFARKLGALMLQSLTKPVKFDYAHSDPKSHKGFTLAGYPQVSGILPLLHMNISEGQFTKMMNSSRNNMASTISKMCVGAGLNKKLASVGFHCAPQSKKSVSMFTKAVIDSIKHRYNTRKTGQKRMNEMAKAMKWQVQRKIIPKTSVSWC